MGTNIEIAGTPTCRMCGSNQSELVSCEIAGATQSAVYRCKSCDIVYLFPIMTEDEERAFYQAEFEKYMKARSGPGWLSPEAHFRSYQAEGERRLPLVRPFLRPEDALLEIGSSTGYFLDDLRGSVCSVTGVEPSEAYRSFAQSRGIETVTTVEELGVRTFNVIVLYYVLEHLRNPLAYLQGLRPRLRVEGRLLIEVPNVEDALLTQYAIPAFPRFYWQKAHYHNFSRRTLADLLDRAAFIAQLFPVQRYDLSNHIVWMTEGKPGGAGRFKPLFSPEVDAAYAEALKRRWVCDTVFAVATPK